MKDAYISGVTTAKLYLSFSLQIHRRLARGSARVACSGKQAGRIASLGALLLAVAEGRSKQGQSCPSS